MVQRKAGAWTNRTLAQLISDLAALGTTFQPLDSDLTAIAALSPSNDDVVQRKSGVWTKRTMPQLMVDLGALGQIPFPATQNPSADANTLDDYEEGSWTPTFITTGTQPTGVTYTLQLGRYIKIGSCVLFWFRLQLSSVGTGGTGNGRVGGLPFVVAAGSGIYNASCAVANVTLDSGYSWICAAPQGTLSEVNFTQSGSNIGIIATPYANFTNTADLRGSAAYTV